MEFHDGCRLAPAISCDETPVITRAVDKTEFPQIDEPLTPLAAPMAFMVGLGAVMVFSIAIPLGGPVGPVLLRSCASTSVITAEISPMPLGTNETAALPATAPETPAAQLLPIR